MNSVDFSFVKTCLNGLNTLAGLGILSISSTLAEAGWLALIFLMLVAIASFYTGILLQRCIESNPNITTYHGVGKAAFGESGRFAISILMHLELYLVAVQFLIVEADNFDKLFPNENIKVLGMKITGKQAFVLTTAVIVLPSTWLKNLDILAYVSAGGIFSILIIVGCVLWTGAMNEVSFHNRGRFIKWKGIPTAVSLFLFCYSAHPILPTIYTSMNDKSMFPKVLCIIFALCTLNYAIMAISGYLMYGEDLNSQITLNLPKEKISSKIAIYTTLITPLAKYALVVTPIANSIEDMIKYAKFRVISILIRSLIVFSTVFIALVLPFFGIIVALTGSFLCTTTTLLFPCLCYLKIFKNSVKRSEKIAIVLIMVIGVFIVVIGTYTSLMQIVHNL